MLKYVFSLKTRDGQTVEHISIAARDQAEAEHKLRQMYHHCEIVRCEELQPEIRQGETMSFEDIMTLISK